MRHAWLAALVALEVGCGEARRLMQPRAPAARTISRPARLVTCAAAVAPVTCSWHRAAGTCSPSALCRAHSCGILTCKCSRTPSSARAPWDLLGLNFSESLDNAAVAKAFGSKATALHPAKNGACLRLANSEFVSLNLNLNPRRQTLLGAFDTAKFYLNV